MTASVRRIARLVPVCLLCAISVAAQPSLLPHLQTIRQQYPTPMSKPQIGELLTRVAQSEPGFVLLLKREGNNCPAMGTLVSCDYLVYAPTGQGFDVLRDQEGEAAPVWHQADSFTSERYVAVGLTPAPVQPPAPVPTKPEPQPLPAFDWGPVWVRFDRLETSLAEIMARDLAQQKRLEQISAKLHEHDERPAWLRRFITSPYGVAILSAAGTLLSNWMITREPDPKPVMP